MLNERTNDFPTILVIFGATGDLMGKKIIPALYDLFLQGKLPTLFQIVGFSHRAISEIEFKGMVMEMIKQYKGIGISAEKTEAFMARISYCQGDFEKREGYDSLSKRLGFIDGNWKLCANKLFYLAVPPQFYKGIFTHLHGSGLTIPCGPEEGWTRVIVEKPFGRDLKTAEELDRLLGKMFKEVQIYRIDHYLAKEMVQNIVSFRFSNNLFERTWNKDSIKKIEIRAWEKVGVENRGAFYEGVGALRDFGQNHLLQMLAFVTMPQPSNLSAEAIRQSRAEVLKTLIIPKAVEVKKNSFRAQYEGYRNIVGVSPDSQVETYFKIKAMLAHPSWEGVPIVLESGKRMGEQRKEIVVHFKSVQSGAYLEDEKKAGFENKVIFSMEPDEGITISFLSKKPGFTYEVEPRVFNFSLRGETKRVQYVEEYQKLLLDCIAGDQTLFVSTEEIKAMWRFTDSFLHVWQRGNTLPLQVYAPDSAEVSERFVVESEKQTSLKKELAIVGMGKMGANMARRLRDNGWRVVIYNRSEDTAKAMEKEGFERAQNYEEIAQKLTYPRVVWLMVPAGKPVDDVLFGKEGLVHFLRRGDTVIDGGNSYYKDDIPRAKKLAKKGITFLDVGTSGGPAGARNGACLMIGGDQKTFTTLEQLFKDFSKNNAYEFFPGVGAGHFVKMIHNGIEYGMMQAIAEGCAILKKSKYRLSLINVARVYNNGSVIESRLIDWLGKAFRLHGENLKEISGVVGHTGEGAWTVMAAKELKLKAKVIEESLKFRIKSAKNPEYAGKVLSALREQFGGHKAQ